VAWILDLNFYGSASQRLDDHSFPKFGLQGADKQNAVTKGPFANEQGKWRTLRMIRRFLCATFDPAPAKAFRSFRRMEWPCAPAIAIG